MSVTFLPETIEWFTHVELGEVEQAITAYQRGRVRYMATSWFARFYELNGQTELLPGTTVGVVGRQGLTLIIVPLDDANAQPQMLVADRSGSNQSKRLHLLQKVSSVFGNLLS